MEKIVVLIDGDKDEHEIFQSQLQRFNPLIKVLSAFDSEEGLHLLFNGPADYIFLDINMPVINGIDLLKRIKNNKFLKHIPVFIYSTSDGRAYKKMALTLGAANYFTKPTSIYAFHKIFAQVFTGGRWLLILRLYFLHNEMRISQSYIILFAYEQSLYLLRSQSIENTLIDSQKIVPENFPIFFVELKHFNRISFIKEELREMETASLQIKYWASDILKHWKKQEDCRDEMYHFGQVVVSQTCYWYVSIRDRQSSNGSQMQNLRKNISTIECKNISSVSL